ncbi:MAG: tyrosine--tRNA ligase [Defluviitaleaceae bacterium]|nr:tyrosine--tRNA ligase [Defluviitaleaceae bacterium]
MGSTNVYDILEQRGYIDAVTHQDELRQAFGAGSVTFYIGYDPTADSLHVGHLLTLMAMSQMQRMGHKPIALMGGGTGMVGDTTGRNDMRRVMTLDEIDSNIARIQKQMSHFIDFSDGKAMLVNNGDWLRPLNYLDFVREYGIHFPINRMLSAETYKTRMEQGLNFFELSYMTLQAYDFLYQYREFGCTLQCGGSDQWANILAGVELVRRVDSGSAYGLTFKLLQTSSGQKMGKTQAGSVWLDASKTSPYEFFQYFRNIDDADVRQSLCLLTFLPLDEIDRLTSEGGAALNHAKERFAYEVTKIVHSKEAADGALAAAKALFSGEGPGGDIPATTVTRVTLATGINVADLLVTTGLTPSKSESRRLIEQGGLRINDQKIESIDHVVDESALTDGAVMLQKGKKVYHKVIVSE